VTRVVLDPAAFLEWFDPDPGPGARLRTAYESGSLGVVVPRDFSLHLLDAARERVRGADGLARLAEAVERVGFDRREAPVDLVAARVASGWPLRAAQYAALAEALDVPLVAGDPELRQRAAPLLLPD